MIIRYKFWFMIFNDFLFEEINLVCMLILLKSHPIYNILSSENMDNWIKQGLNAKLISLSDDGSTITYIKQGKSRNFNNPEEKVQAEALQRVQRRFLKSLCLHKLLCRSYKFCDVVSFCILLFF